jgi:hypothetical protein
MFQTGEELSQMDLQLIDVHAAHSLQQLEGDEKINERNFEDVFPDMKFITELSNKQVVPVMTGGETKTVT